MRNRKCLKKRNPKITHRRTCTLVYFDFVLNGSRLDGVEKKARIAFFRIWSEHHHALTKAATKPLWDDANFTHWSFASDYQISCSEFGSATSLSEVCFVCIALNAEIKAPVSNVLAA